MHGDGDGDVVRILHVDDDPDFADVAATFLEREAERFSVETVTSASDGLERLGDDAFDCIVSDYDMPQQNGIEFLEAVRDTHPDLPFILFTGKGSEEIASEAISAGVTDYLQKGTDTSQYTVLANRIANAVETYRSQQELESSQRRLSLFIDQSAIGVIEWDEEFNFVGMNTAAEDILGYSEDELAGNTWETIVPEVDRNAVDDVVTRLLEDTGGYHSINENVRADGERIICEWHNRVVTDDSGEVVAIFSQFHDITARHEHERAVRELHATTQSFLQAETAEEVADIVVDAVRDILGMPSNAVHLYDADENCLRPAAWTEYGEAVLGEIPTFHPGDSLAWEVFESGEPQFYGDVSTIEGRFSEETGIRSELLLPLGDHGVFIVGTENIDAFDATDQSLVQTLTNNATSALNRIEREQELREERSFIDQALDSLDDVFYVLDTDIQLLRWNDRVAEVTGYSHEEIDAMDALELFPEDERERVAAAVGETLAGESIQLRTEVRTADGDRLPYEFSGRRLTDTDGELIGVVGIGRDISTQLAYKRQVEQLQDCTQQLMYTATKAETATLVVETAGDVLGAELSGVHVLSEDGESLEPLAFLDSVRDTLDEPPTYERDDDSDPAAKAVWDAFTSGELLHIEDTREYGRLAEVTPARSGLVHPLDDYGVFIASATEPHAFDDTDRALVEILATALTAALDRVERESQLREREAQLETERDRWSALFEMIPEPISHVRHTNGELRLLDVNPAFEEKFGYDRESVVGGNPNELIVPSEVKEEAQTLDQRALEEGTVKQEIRRRTADGIGDFLFRSIPIGDAEPAEEYFGVYVDISELKAYERRLERQNERLDEFASIVSHDLRNPLNVAQSRLELARDDCDSDHLDHVGQAHERMGTLIDDLLALARRGEDITDIDDVALADLVRLCWQTVETGDATLVVDSDCTVQADRGQLQRLLENLVRNAIDHGGADVTVTVGELDGGFYVEDDGPGIAADERDRVLDIGYSTTQEGTGFGLNIVAQIADAHGWDITVTDGTDGGARFEITGVDCAEA